MVASEPRVATVRPPVVEYTRAEHARVAEEVASLPEDTLITGWLADYSVMRDQARACR